jgi:hypothetical protein
LTGTLQATVIAGDSAKGPYAFSVDLPVNTNFVRGEYHTRKDGNDWGRYGVTGYVWGQGEPQGDAVLRLALDRAIKGRMPVTILASQRAGQFAGGMAVAGNQAQQHRVDLGGLRIERGRVSGSVKVVIQPDRFFLSGGRAIECAYQLDAEVGDDGRLAGTFSGEYGRRQNKRGDLTGSILSAGQLWREFNRED